MFIKGRFKHSMKQYGTLITQTRGGLRAETSQGSDTAQGRGQVCHLVNLWVSGVSGPAVGAQKDSSRDTVQVWVLRRISCDKKIHFLNIKFENIVC
jgi:hypothetical protein